MRWSTAEKVNAGFVMALAVVALIGIASITGIQRFAATTRDINDTHDALTVLQSVLLSLADAESSQRGYLITGNADYLEPIDSLTARALVQIHSLRETTLADAEQQYRLSMLASQVAARIRLVYEVARLRDAEGLDAAAARVEVGDGDEMMASVRSLASDFEQQEIERLMARSRIANRNAWFATLLIAGGGAFAFLIVLLSGTLIRRDYTERRRAELALRDSETLLSQFMENLPIGVIVVDTEWRPRFANNAAVEILGPTVLIDDGAHPLPLYRAGERRVYPVDQTPLALALNGQTATIDDAEVRVGDRYVPVQLSAAPIYDASGRIAYTIAAFIDITERHRAEAALRAARDAAETASRTKSDFLARMSHELRTPLNSVIGFANILLKNKSGNLRSQEVAYLDRIQDNGRHLLLLINDILDLSKIEAGKIEVENETIDLKELITDVSTQFELQVRSTGVRLKLNIPKSVAPHVTDPARLRQVLTNLIGNAVKFTEKGQITISVDVDPDTARAARIRVSDTGIGIPDERLGAIFDAFEQAESTTSRKYGGTGLGLPISRALCELLGYTLTVRSRVQTGTEFTVDMIPSTASVVEKADEHEAAAGPLDGRPGERLVLIVDDEADSRILLTHYVEEFGCRAIATHSPASAMKLARELKPDLITLDLMMPGLNGWDMLSSLKGDPELGDIPIVIISVVAQESRATLAGALDVLQKPIDRRELYAVLDRNLGARRARILIVDDSADARTLLQEMLGDTASELRTAANGQEALTVLRDFEPDLVLLDMVMPIMDGLTFLEVFRGTPRFRDVPVVVISAKELSGDERERVVRHTAAVVRKGKALETDLRRVLSHVLAEGRNDPAADDHVADDEPGAA
ncbi:MAG: response regulator [Gemmatimonadetes bacterium]|nr:response regulator [Gemmatimonadota bacterium]